MNKKRKVFCIGWHKTGTSSLGLALIELDYTVVGCRLDLEDTLRAGDYSVALKLAEKFDAVQDIPWSLLYRELDEVFPGSRFVFTDREDIAWLNSAVGHFGDRHVSMHEFIYGAGRCVGNEDLYLERFRRHRAEVQRYFSGRNDFLQMNLEDGDGWQELCRFLGRRVPNRPWPHANKGRHSFTWQDTAISALRRSVPLPLRRFIFRLKLNVLAAFGRPDPRNRFNNFEENRLTRERQGK